MIALQHMRQLCLAALLLWLPGAHGASALLLEIHGAIGPATADYVKRGLQDAQQRHAQLVILRIDTPGGLDTAMRDIVQHVLASPLPVVGYVAPGGARAASAGAYILYATHVAAMAPATNVGAATPVRITGLPGNTQRDARPDAMTHKIINDAVAYIRSLAQMRGRNAEWAEQAVRAAASLSAEEALERSVIDLIAADDGELLRQLDGRAVNVLGREQVLDTRQLNLVRVAPDWRARLLAVITDPNIAYILMLVGIYGLIYEFTSPGMIVPGVAGAISLLLALFAFQVLPVNYAGLALMLLGIAFMIAEVFVPSFGALGIGGVIGFVIGSIMLLDSDVPGYGISVPLIAFFAFTSAALFMFVLSMALRARQRPVVSGMEELIGSHGEVLADFENDGRVRVHSESWRARSAAPLRRGQQVRVVAVDGLCLRVEPLTDVSSRDAGATTGGN